jgi:hypothetical protein
MQVRTCLPICVLALTGFAGSARAQSGLGPADKPYPGLFGNGGRTALDLSLITYSGYDHADLRSTSPDITTDGDYLGGTAGLNLVRPIGRYTVHAYGSTDFRYYMHNGVLSGLTAKTSAAGTSIGRPLGEHGTLHVTQGVSTASFYQFDPFSGYAIQSTVDLALPTSDYRIARGQTYSYDMSAGTDWRIGRHDLLTLDYDFRYWSFPGERLNLLTSNSGFHVHHGVTRTVSAVFGYGYERGTAAQEARPAQYQRIDVGLEYNAHPFDRHTTVSGSAGPTIVAIRNLITGSVVNVPELLVTTSLRHEFSRSWSLGLNYRREPLIIELYANPIYSDSVFFTLAGSPKRRVSLALSGGYTRSTQDAGRGSPGNETYFGSARTSWVLRRALATHVEYAYYGFHTAPNQVLPLTVSQIGRQSVRVGLDWALPLLKPGARP